MANALALPHILEIAFDALTAAVGSLVILLALRVAPALTLSAHRIALRISIVAAVLIIAAQMAEVLAEFSRLKVPHRSSASATPPSTITPTNSIPPRRTTRRSMNNTPSTNSRAAKPLNVLAPVSQREHFSPSRMDDASLKEGIFEHLVVSSGVPKACR
jgi:hypothetical protein